MARVIDAKYATFLGAPEQIAEALQLLARSAAVVDVKFANFVVTRERIDLDVIRAALATTPWKQN